MRTVIVLLLTIHLSLASAATLTGRVVRVIDGDTIVILSDGKIQYRIRLQGIDAPESGQPFGNKSKQNLANMIAGKDVIVDYNKLDRYERVVGTVFLDGKDICLEQIRAGLAWHYKHYQDEQTAGDRKLYAEAETQAKAERRGLWSESFPVAPWDWRHGQMRPQSVIGIPNQPSEETFKCGTRHFCREMNSCKEAKYYLHNCGVSSLDGDGDGVPCESLCR
jgi:endonuclease YncB( thermonuclease family)